MSRIMIDNTFRDKLVASATKNVELYDENGRTIGTVQIAPEAIFTDEEIKAALNDSKVWISNDQVLRDLGMA